jgi:ribosomal protein S18 acetylase RimI-like enzyme
MLQLIKIHEETVLMEEVRKLFREYEKELDENLCFQQFEDEVKDPIKKYGPPKGVLYVAEWEGEVAGCIALADISENSSTAFGTTCEMKRLYVRPQFRNHKIGKTMVEQLLKDAAQLGYTKMKLDTLQKLQPAIALYKQYDFSETTAYYKNPLPGAVYMEKTLLGVMS